MTSMVMASSVSPPQDKIDRERAEQEWLAKQVEEARTEWIEEETGEIENERAVRPEMIWPIPYEETEEYKKEKRKLERLNREIEILDRELERIDREKAKAKAEEARAKRIEAEAKKQLAELAELAAAKGVVPQQASPEALAAIEAERQGE